MENRFHIYGSSNVVHRVEKLCFSFLYENTASSHRGVLSCTACQPPDMSNDLTLMGVDMSET